MSKIFNFKSFSITRNYAGMKLSTDAVLLGTWTAQIFPHKKRIIDAGTGTGVLSLLYAQFNPSSTICGLDIEPGAIVDATLNFKSSPFSNQLTAIRHDFLTLTKDVLPWHDSTDLIICNPPYFPSHNNSGCNDKARYTARHNNTLDPELFFAKAAQLLSDNGYLSLMLPIKSTNDCLLTASKHGLQLIQHFYISSVHGKEPYLSLLGLQKTAETKQLPTVQNNWLFEKQSKKDSKPVKSIFWQHLTNNVYLSNEEKVPSCIVKKDSIQQNQHHS